MTRSRALLPIVVFALAVGLRAWSAAAVNASPFGDVLFGDGAAYDRWADELAAGDWLGDEVFYQAPLYPYFLGVVYVALGDDPATVRAVQAVLGALGCALLALATRRFFGARAGWAAGLLLAAYAPAVFYDALVQKASLGFFLLAAGVWGLACHAAAPRARTALATGVVFGALALTRENALLFPPLVAVWMALAGRGERSARARAAGAALFLVGVAGALAPAALRNLAVGGELHVTTSQFGSNFYHGNNAEATGSYRAFREGRADARYERDDARRLAEHALGRELGPGEVSSYWTGRAFEFIREQPGRWLRLEGRKLALAGNAVEVHDTESLESYQDWSPPLRLAGPLLHFGLLAPLALLGLLATRGERKGEVVLLWMAAAYLATLLVFYVFGRYRYPLVPLLAPFAGAGLAALPGVLRERRPLPLAAVLVAAVACNWPLLSAARQRSVSYSNLGNALVEAGRTDDAVRWLERAVEVQPDYAAGHLNLGAAELHRGDAAAAEAHFRRALELDPDAAGAHYDLGIALEGLGRLDEAEAVLREAVDREPDAAEAHFVLARVLNARGQQLDEAEEHYRTAVHLEPGHAAAHSNLGLLLVTTQRPEEGERHYQLALVADPDHLEANTNLALLQLSRGDVESARARLSRAIELAPDRGRLHYYLGMTFVRERRAADAAGHFRRALELDPEDAAARQALERMEAVLKSGG